MIFIVLVVVNNEQNVDREVDTKCKAYEKDVPCQVSINEIHHTPLRHEIIHPPGNLELFAIRFVLHALQSLFFIAPKYAVAARVTPDVPVDVPRRHHFPGLKGQTCNAFPAIFCGIYPVGKTCSTRRSVFSALKLVCLPRTTLRAGDGCENVPWF